MILHCVLFPRYKKEESLPPLVLWCRDSCFFCNIYLPKRNGDLIHFRRVSQPSTQFWLATSWYITYVTLDCVYSLILLRPRFRPCTFTPQTAFSFHLALSATIQKLMTPDI
ncbi:hypothetical protein GALMADRAFT_1287796 [Galerina marginata CBS 339.88]|uniref:Uncharacterized protein n=1 Tax=Galerina marginata (strain CBS 339.88) TaxID=685588 RepID=A0A067T777_GALM3|nr:hypothetical protein GALMADRAFT_1287796 [Galerina marginata CBS 339.88]